MEPPGLTPRGRFGDRQLFQLLVQPLARRCAARHAVSQAADGNRKSQRERPAPARDIEANPSRNAICREVANVYFGLGPVRVIGGGSNWDRCFDRIARAIHHR
jgi:hypothetical protein